jgi:hypothetical protein
MEPILPPDLENPASLLTLKRFDQLSITNHLGVVGQVVHNPGAESIGSNCLNRVPQRSTHADFPPARQTSQSLDSCAGVPVSHAIPPKRPYDNAACHSAT